MKNESGIIRRARIEDASTVEALVKRLSRFYLAEGYIDIPTWLEATLTDVGFLRRFCSNKYINFVYEIDGNVVAYISVKCSGHLFHLFVDEQYQGRGIATFLWEKARSYIEVEMYTVRSSKYAIPVYQKFGFEAVGALQEKGGIEYQEMEMKI